MHKADERTLLIKQGDGTELQIDIPDTWKVTFGPAARGESAPSKGHGMKMPMALRLYESEKKQRAVFTDVVSFRDMAIPMRVKTVNVQEKQGFMECEGTRKQTTFQAKTVSWINPDDPDAPIGPLLAMPDDDEMFNTISVD